MKIFKSLIALLIFSVVLTGFSSCLVLHTTESGNNGKHKGWYKNSNNPHNPNTTNPGNGNSKGNKHGKKNK